MGRVGQKLRNACGDFYAALARTKSLNTDQLQETELKRCLSIFDLIALGTGATLGAGIYVLTAQVAKNQTGPAIVVSFLIGAVASLLAGICYAEFAARVPRAGSAYVYSYVSVGEGWAFVIGWNMILEYVIGTASLAKAWSQYFDSFFNDTIQRSIVDNVGELHGEGIANFPDFLAFGLIIAITLVLSLGVKMSSVLNTILTVINAIVVVLIVVVGSFYCDGHNWTDSPGFFPYGFRGVLSGAATCFYAFIGFDVVATSGEEARKPTTSIPIAIVMSLVICFLAYFGVSTVTTLMIPWNELPETAALSKVFALRGVNGAKYFISVGAMCGLTSSLLGGIFPLPRIVYSMASDGLLFRFLGSVNSKTNTPLLATWLCGILAAVLALVVDLQSLVEMMSIGTLMAYTLVSTGVLVLRYQRDRVGLTALDMYEDFGSPDGGTENKKVTSSMQPSSEDTGLLRVGGEIKTVKYVPKQDTTVFKRVDADNEKSGSKPDREMLEEVRSKREREVLGRMASYMSESSTPPPDSTYHRVDSNYSLNSLYYLFNAGEESSKEPTENTRQVANASIIALIIVGLAIWILAIYGGDFVYHAEWWTILLFSLMALAMLVLFIVLARQPQNQTKLNFKVPLVPLIPLASVLVNIHLMISLSFATWMRFVVWMVLGGAIYFGYGIRNSSERDRSEDQEVILYNLSDGQNILEERR